MNKYQKALFKLTQDVGAYVKEDKLKECEEHLETLQELNEKFEKICLELQNASFMDTQCKLIELDIIKGIIKG